MSSRLAFQTQLASIMEVLANAAVAEICKLVDDDYAVVSLQMSQCQRENKALKRKLHLLELKMARGNAERRLRESAVNSRPRVQITTGDRHRESSPSTSKIRNTTIPVLLSAKHTCQTAVCIKLSAGRVWVNSLQKYALCPETSCFYKVPHCLIIYCHIITRCQLRQTSP